MGDTPVLQSSEKMFSILEYLIEAGGAGVTEVANTTSIPKSTVHLHLKSLIESGYVVKSGQEYRSSLKLLELGERARQNAEVYRKGREEIDTLARETNELVNLGVLENGKVRLVYPREANDKQSTASPSVSTEFEATRPRVSVLSEDYEHAPGTALDIHATAMGKAILANLPGEAVDRIVDRHGLHKHTDNTVSTRDELRAELESVRADGYATDIEGRIDELCCVAASISPKDDPIAAVSISGFAEQWNGEYRETLAAEVQNTARMIEIKLTHS